MSEKRLRIAIQKSGRLSDGSFELLKSCGLSISRGRDNLYGRVQELPIDVLLVRDDDIPEFVADGACDIGIVGENVAEEDRLAAKREEPAVVVMKLGFSRCRLMLAAPKEWAWDGPVLLDRLDVAYGDDRLGGTGSGGSGSTGGSSGGATDGLRIGRRFKIVNNATAVVTPVEGVEVALHQGLKFVAERIGDKRYTSSSALFGGDLRFDLTDRLDLGVRASLVTGLDHDQLVYAFGPTLGFKFGERAWLGLGYNFQGYEDRDFADAGYAAQGPYLRFRLALDEDLLEGVMNDGP